MTTGIHEELYSKYVEGLIDLDEYVEGLGYKPLTRTLGQTIGVLTDNFSITNDGQDKVQLIVRWDFRTASDADVKSWLCGNRRIAFQRPSRAMSKVKLESVNNTTIPAIDAGKKVKTREQRINELEAMGLPRPLAVMAIDEPDKFQAAMDSVDDNE